MFRIERQRRYIVLCRFRDREIVEAHMLIESVRLGQHARRVTRWLATRATVEEKHGNGGLCDGVMTK